MEQDCEHEYAYEGSSDGGPPWRCEHCGEEAPHEWLEDQARYLQEEEDRRYCDERLAQDTPKVSP